MTMTCGPVWVITTEGGGIPNTREVAIWSIVWSGHTTASGSSYAQISDCSGHVLWFARANCDRSTVYAEPIRSKGFVVDKLTQGTLYVQMDA